MTTLMPDTDYPEGRFETVEELLEYLQEIKYSVGRGANEDLATVVAELKEQRNRAQTDLRNLRRV